MILESPIKLKNGVIAAYVEIKSVFFDAQAGKANVIVSLWINREAKNLGYLPVAEYAYQVDADLNQTLAKEAIDYLNFLTIQYLPGLENE